MKLNQPYYLNVILLEIFFWVRKAWEAFLLSVQIALFQDRSNFKSDWSRLCTFLMISLSLGQGLSEFNNLKFSSYAKREHQRDTTIIPFGSLIIFLILGCLATKKIHFFHLDSKWIFLIKKKKWVASSYSFISHLLNWLGLAKNPFILKWIQEVAKIKLGVDSKCAPEEKGVKLNVERC